MSIIGLILNTVLIGLLLAALSVGLRLNRRLKVLRDAQDNFTSAVHDLNTAAARAEQGLADLRAATDEATDLLADRIEKGRALAAKLERLVEGAPPLRTAVSHVREAVRDTGREPAREPAEPGEAEMASLERRLGALLSAARNPREEPPRREMPPLRREMPPLRRTQLDDDLFEDAPMRLGVRR